MILVTAGNGNIARQLIPALSRAGLAVRALRATPGGQHAALALGASEVTIGDLRNRDDVMRAMVGVDAVFHICPGGLAYWETDIGSQVIEAAQRQGVRHLVVSTLLHPIIADLLQHATKRDVEEHLVSSRINWTILQPCDYMQTRVPPSTFETGVLPTPYGIASRQSAVDLRDVADAAVKVLSEGEPHYFARYELCGLPRSFNGDELAGMASRACGRPITLKPVSVVEFMRLWAREVGPPIGSAHGLDDPQARAFAKQVLNHIEAWYRDHDYVGNPNVLSWLLQREPRSMEDYLRDLCRGVFSPVTP